MNAPFVRARQDTLLVFVKSSGDTERIHAKVSVACLADYDARGFHGLEMLSPKKLLGEHALASVQTRRPGGSRESPYVSYDAEVDAMYARCRAASERLGSLRTVELRCNALLDVQGGLIGFECPGLPGVLDRAKRLRRQRIAVARQQQKGETLLHDPIEDDPDLAFVLRRADELAEQKLAQCDHGRGFCHRFWRTKERILRTKFSVIWFSPSAMNPGTKFD